MFLKYFRLYIILFSFSAGIMLLDYSLWGKKEPMLNNPFNAESFKFSQVGITGLPEVYLPKQNLQVAMCLNDS